MNVIHVLPGSGDNFYCENCVRDNALVRALEKDGWNVTATSKTLGIPLSTMKFKMDRLEIRGLARKIRGN